MITVVTPASTQALTTLAAVKAELALTGGGDDGYLSDAINGVSGTIARWCNRSFGRETVSEAIRLQRGLKPLPELRLSRWPVASITSIAEGTGPALTYADWEADLDNGLIYRLDGADNRRQWTAPKITVIYAAGYLLPGEQGRTLPNEIERAAILLASAAYRARGRDSFVKSEETPGVLRTEYFFGTPGDGGMPPEVEGLLVPFRNVPMG